jgi:hypothetical protein
MMSRKQLVNILSLQSPQLFAEQEYNMIGRNAYNLEPTLVSEWDIYPLSHS